MAQQKIAIKIKSKQGVTSKAQELEAMEMALKQATEETHKQRLEAEIKSEPNKFINIEQKAKERADKALKAK